MTDRKKHIPAAFPELGKLPPQAIDVEEAVLGAMLLEFKSCQVEGFDTLSRDSFYKLEHQNIFAAIHAISEADGQVDILSTTETLRKHGTLPASGGPGYIARLTNKVASAAHYEYHCQILKEKQVARNQIQFGSELIRRAYDEQQDVFETNEYMADAIFKIDQMIALKSEQSLLEMVHDAITSIEKSNGEKGLTGLPTGFREQDALFGGWQKSEMIVMAARPGMGKTAKMLCEALNAATVYKKKLAVFSLEMSRTQLIKRLISIVTGIPADFLKSGMTDIHWKVLNERIETLIQAHIEIVDDCYTLQDIKTRAKRIRLKLGGLDGIYVDYLQLVETQAQNREQEISKISRTFKKMSKEMDIPVIALSQLSRKVDERGGDKRPYLSDLRESGALEQDADVVVFLYRPQYYGIQGHDGLAYLIVAKHRNGSLHDGIKMKFIHEKTKFLDEYQDEIPF